MVIVREDRRSQDDRRNNKGLKKYIRLIKSSDRRKLEQQKNDIISKDFITWLSCVFISLGLLTVILILAYMKG